MRHDHTQDEFYMRRAFLLALRGSGYVRPNPLVGCVIVHNDTVIGEGWHMQWGGPHAEVNAIASVLEPELLGESTLYVNLEPCSHFGKTPPCADLIIKHRVKRVVISTLDSNPLVGGEGVKKLGSAGIDVVTGILQEEGRALNKRFFTFMEKQRPYIILKWAETSDGFIARENYDSKWISNEGSRQRVHKMRAEDAAVLVGTRTAQHDDPQLTVRNWSGPQPTRIVIDRFLKLSDKLRLFDGSVPTLCYNVLKHAEQENLVLARIDEQDFVHNLVKDLHQRRVQSVIIEGGSTTLQMFIDAHLWDEARVFKSARQFGKGIKGPLFKGRLISEETITDDRLFYYIP